jgi:natural product biosynthesis luciferase-like monooxygenase protein
VLPLQNPMRVAEEWSVVDNLSGGRVELAFASGWLADDFVLAPDGYATRKDDMYRQIQTVRKLWNGETIRLRNGRNEETDIRVFPNPIQRELPVWITATHEDTFVRAGRIGAHVLTGLMEQSMADCGRCIQAYRRALAESGHDPQQGVAVMLHTYLGTDLHEVREKVRAPMCDYLRSFLHMTGTRMPVFATEDADELGKQDQQALLQFAFERYFSSSALLGTPDTAREMVAKLRAIDADEIACLLDFGLETDVVVAGLACLDEVRASCAARPAARPSECVP